jgi:hypothetical protein
LAEEVAQARADAQEDAVTERELTAKPPSSHMRSELAGRRRRRYDRHENLRVGLWLGGLLVCVLTGQRAVGKELRAAEAAVDARDGSTVTF